MNDRRVTVGRETLEALMDSISATCRLKRWDAAESVPESLQKSAKLLEQNLVAANKSTGTSFAGNALVVARLNGISDAIRRLDRAYTEYKARVEQDPSQLASALDALDAEVDEVKSDSDRWS
jgi:hypothetical protein